VLVDDLDAKLLVVGFVGTWVRWDDLNFEHNFIQLPIKIHE
jgi:hypothetical protein